MEVKLSSMNVGWNKPPPRVFITGDTQSCDPETLRNLRAEGFQVTYFPYNGDPKAFRQTLNKVAEPLGLGEYWAIVGGPPRPSQRSQRGPARLTALLGRQRTAALLQHRSTHV